ncbi:hypothetical protein EON82_18160, partial [bacterium]
MKTISALLVLTVGAAAAHANPVLNGSFETNNVGGGYLYSYQGVVAAPWSFANGAGVTASNTAWGGVAQDGNAFAFLQSTQSTAASVSQNLSGLTTGTQYKVSFYARQRPGYGQNEISVKAGGVDTLTAFAPAADWTLYSGLFTASGSTSNLEFSVGYGLNNSGDADSYIDNVSVQAVPEPASM